jgi:hypothetical protein
MKRIAKVFFVTAMLFGAGAALAPSVASARPCCSACDRFPLPSYCQNGCTPTCNQDDAEETARLIYDEQQGLCYIGQ